ncbi:MAG: trigger factor [Micavibrio sp.]|nr:MAG: trigger factor [Micavibrio sp.]
MQVKELKQNGLEHEIEVTVKANDIDKRVDVRLKEVGKTMKMPGFRPGKVPLKILKQKYGKAIMGEVLEAAVNDTSVKVMKDKKLRPAMKPNIEVKSFDEGKDLVYAMKVEVLPEFKVKDFKGVKLEKPVAKPDDKAVTEALERIAEGRTSSEPIKGNRASKKGDILVFDFSGRTADDNVEHDGMQADGHQLELGSNQFIPGFEDQLIGTKAGEKVEVKVSFPKEYGATDLAGRDAIFDCDIKEIREPAEAKIDDEFAKSLGMEDLAALKKAVEEQMSKEFAAHSRLKLKKALLDHLDDNHDFEVPPGMLDMEYNNIIQQIEMERQQNPQQDSGEDAPDLSDDEKAELKQIAERRVRLGLILSEVGNSNNIKISDPELQKSVITEAQKYPGQEKEVFDYFSKNPQALESLRAPLFEDKVVDFILELAEVKEVSVTVEELTAEEEEDEAPKKKSATKKKASTAKKSDSSKEAAKKPAASKKKSTAKKKAS